MGASEGDVIEFQGKSPTLGKVGAVSRVVRGAVELTRFVALYVSSSSFRAAVNSARVVQSITDTPQMRREARRARPQTRVHRRLSSAALALAAITEDPAEPAKVNLILSELDTTRLFAGVSTALDIAVAIATGRGVALRIILLSERVTPELGRHIQLELQERAPGVSVVVRGAIVATSFNPADLWIATHWTTAHPVQVAVDDGRISPAQVIYLVQDFEPGFAGWSTPSTVARDTYDAGFQILVNSMPLWRYLAERIGIDVPMSRVFAPNLAVDRIREEPPAVRDDTIRIFFYGRPSKPRNLFDLGVAALEHAALRLGARAKNIEFISAGEHHPDLTLASGVVLRSVGTLDWDEYFALLARTDVALSLQASPHPSHPPLEAAIAGAISITNEFEGTRAGLHPLLWAVEAHPMVLGDAVVRAIDQISGSGRAGFTPTADDSLGRPMTEVVSDLLAELAAAEAAQALSARRPKA